MHVDLVAVKVRVVTAASNVAARSWGKDQRHRWLVPVFQGKEGKGEREREREGEGERERGREREREG